MTLPLQFRFIGAYTPPGQPLPLQFADLTQTISPDALDAGGVGPASVATLQVAGLFAFAAGTATLQGPEQEITPRVPATFLVPSPRVLRGLRARIETPLPDVALPVYAWFGTPFRGVVGASAGAGGFMGSASIRLNDASVRPDGVASLAMGATLVTGDLLIAPSGVEPDAPPVPTVSSGLRTVRVEGVAGDMGDPDVTHWRQRAEPAAINPPAVASPSVARSPSALSPRPGLFALRTGTPTVGRNLEIGVQGLEAGLWGDALVLDNRQSAMPSAIAPDAPPAPSVRTWEHWVLPVGWQHEVPTRAELIPMLRRVTQVDGTDSTAQGFGRANVELEDRTLRAESVWPGPVAERADVTRAGTVLRPQPFEGVLGAAMPAHAVRSVTPSGAEPGYITSLTHARNDAQVIAPTGAAGSIGAAAVASNLQSVATHSAPTEAFGDQWVSRAVRTVAIVEGLSAWPPEPSVELWERYVRPDGVSGWIGSASVIATRNLLTPDVMVSPNEWGVAQIRNWNPEVTSVSAGIHQHAAGAARVWHWERTVYPAGTYGTQHGALVAGDSTRLIRAQPATPPPVPTNALVHFEDGGYPLATIAPASILAGGFGAPVASRDTIQPAGERWSQFGTAQLTRNRIQVAGLPPPGYGSGGQVGFPALPGTQYAAPESVDTGAIGDVTMDPRYIYGPVGGGDGELIDAYLHGLVADRPVFGRAAVTSTLRTVDVTMVSAFGAFGSPLVELAERRITVEGRAHYRRGVPDLGGGWTAEPIGIDYAAVGNAEVSQPIVVTTQTARPSLVAVPQPGTPELQHQHRSINVPSLTAETMGTPSVAHEFEPFDMIGFSATLHGSTSVDRAIRTVVSQGWDSADLYPLPQYIALRMRVWQWSYVRPTSATAPAPSAPQVQLANRLLGVSGIYVQASTPEPAVRAEVRVEPSAINAHQVGSIAFWRPGDPLYPYGSELLMVGTARMDRVLHPIGMVGASGNASIGRPIYTSGEACERPGEHAVSHTGGHVCGRAPRAMAPAGLSPPDIPTAGVGHA